MTRVTQGTIMLVALVLLTVVSAQPAHASLGGLPILEDGTTVQQNTEDDVFGSLGGPTDGGEGDPDSVGGGYGARAGESDLTNLFGGFLGDDDPMDFSQFIYLMMLQFMLMP